MADRSAPFGTVAGQHSLCECGVEKSHTLYGSWKGNKQKGSVLGFPSRPSPTLYSQTPSFPAPTVLTSFQYSNFLPLDPIFPWFYYFPVTP